MASFDVCQTETVVFLELQREAHLMIIWDLSYSSTLLMFI